MEEIEPKVGDLFEKADASSLGQLIVSACNAYAQATLPGDDIFDRTFCNALSALLGQASDEERLHAAKHVINLAGLPSKVYLFFACDEFVIARPFLGEEFLNDEGELLTVAQNGTVKHRLALTKREMLPREVVYAMISFGEQEVIDALIEPYGRDIFIYYDDHVQGSDELQVRTDYVEEEGEAAQEIRAIDVALTNYAKASKLSDIVELMAREINLPKNAVRTLFLKREVEPFSLICKFLEINKDTYEQIILFRTKRLGQLERVARQVTDDYDNVPADIAAKYIEDIRRRIQISPMAIADL